MPGVFLRVGNPGSTGGFSLAMRVCVLKALFFVSSQFVTVNSESFRKVIFSRNFAHARFFENKIQAKGQNHSVVY